MLRRCRKPVLQDEAFLADVRSWDSGDGHFKLWWLGQSGFLLGWNGLFVLLDPYLSDSLTRKHDRSTTPHVRVVERVVDPMHLDFIALTTSSHGHTDHQDPDTLRALLDANPTMRLLVPAATADLCSSRIRIPIDRLTLADEGWTLCLYEFTITAIASAHESIEYDEHGHCRFLGYVLRFGSWTIYHSGDTVIHPTLVKTLRKFSVDVAILPINGRSATRGVPGNLDANEAIHLARDMNARLVIPCHYDMFEFNTADPSDFRAQADVCRQPYRILSVGGGWDSRELANFALSESDRNP